MVAVTQHSFAAGELSPGFWGRTDHPRYRYGVRKAENCIVSAHGSLRKRPGMEFFREIDGLPARMFAIGTSSGAVPAALFRSKIVVFSSPSAQTINIATNFYSEEELNRVQICQLGDTVTLCLAGHRPLELLNSNGVFSVRTRPAVYRDHFLSFSEFNNNLRHGLLAWYEFNDTLKSSTADTEPTISQRGNASFASDGIPASGKCLDFQNVQSVSDIIVYDDESSPDLTYSSNFTISCWVKFPTGINSGYQTPLSSGCLSFERIMSSGNLTVYTGASSAASFNTGVFVPVDEWLHIVFSSEFDSDTIGTRVLHLYINGALEWQKKQYNATIEIQNKMRLVLGAWQKSLNTTLSQPFFGRLSSVGIWNRALTRNEISTLYNNGNGVSYSPDQSGLLNPVHIAVKLNDDYKEPKTIIIDGAVPTYSYWHKNELYDVRLEWCPEDADHPKLPWIWRFGFVYETPERGEFESVSDSYTFKENAACYTDFHSHYIYVAVPESPSGMTLKALKVYRGLHGIFGLVKRAEVSEKVGGFVFHTSTDLSEQNPPSVNVDGSFFEVIDDGSTPDLSQQPPSPLEDDPDIFCTENSYPNSIGWFEQRTVFGGHAKKPRTLFMSKSGQRYEFTKNGEYAPLDSDAMALDLATAEHERITAVTALNGRLIVLTDKNLWACGSTGQAMTPSDASAVCYNGVGCSGLKPLALRNSLLFVSQNGNEIFEIRADQQGTQWATRELGTFARHLLDGHQIVAWDYQSTPDPVVWVVREDGVLLSMSYNAETELCAWTRHKTNAAVKSVCVIGTDVYLSVVRNGHWQAEKMPMQGSTLFLDGMRHVSAPSAASAAGIRAWNEFSPAGALPAEGPEKLAIMPVSASGSGPCLAGDAVECTVELLDAVSFEDVGLRPKTLKKISVDFISNSTLSLSEDMKGRSTPERLNGTSERRIAFAHVIHGYGAEATGAIRSSQPCPMTLLGVAREVDFGESSMQGAGGAQGGR